MKNKFYLVFTLIFSIIGYAQTYIGAYSAVDGGFEGHTATLAKSFCFHITTLYDSKLTKRYKIQYQYNCNFCQDYFLSISDKKL